MIIVIKLLHLLNFSDIVKVLRKERNEKKDLQHNWKLQKKKL